jgi:hypothetical protein
VSKLQPLVWARCILSSLRSLKRRPTWALMHSPHARLTRFVAPL